MIQFISTLGGGTPVDFETAILDGYAKDGGLYVPDHLPQIPIATLEKWSDLSYTELAFEIISLFVDRSIVNEKELKSLIGKSFDTFEVEEVIPFYQMKSRKNTYIMELFHGQTLSFKDVAMGFLVNLFDFFLTRRGERRSILVATTGDTGPAAAHAAVGKESIDIWLLYPKGLISEEQERQMTSLTSSNVRAVAVENCPNGGDDLDDTISELMSNDEIREKFGISSVNSINWGRVMTQTIHYFYGYFQMADRVGDEVNFSIPSGAFGNQCSGALARQMGLPIKHLICSNNENATLYRIFTEGSMFRKKLVNTPSSAIDIILPYNFWRFLYFRTGENQSKLKKWYDQFHQTGRIDFDEDTFIKIKEGILAEHVSDETTLALIKKIFDDEGYLMDPHLAVAVAGAIKFEDHLNKDAKLVCVATAHPSKFPDVIRKALSLKQGEMIEQGKHPSLEKAKDYFHNILLCDLDKLRPALIHSMESAIVKN